MEGTQEWALRTQEVLRAIGRSPVMQPEVVMLVAVNDTSYGDAALVFGCDVGTDSVGLLRAPARSAGRILADGSAKAAIISRHAFKDHTAFVL